MQKQRMYSLCCFLLFLVFCISANLSAQHSETAPQSVFIGRLSTPVKMEVKKNENGYVFSARNSSMFPYQFELKFNELVNLSPMMTNYKTILQPGINRLFSLNIMDKQTECNYQYSISYRMGNPKDKADKGFPYIIPIGEGKIVEYVTEDREGNKTVLISLFRVSPGDTIYASRRGFVTATPNAEIELDRIRNKTSLELRHYDGTVAVYDAIDPDNTFARLGNVIYPGQPLGLSDTTYFRLTVYEFLGEGRINSFRHMYSNQNSSQLKTAKDIMGETVKYPEEVITRELSKREIKKLKKGLLY